MSKIIDKTIDKFNKIFKNLLIFQFNEERKLKYNKNFDFKVVDLEILKQIDFGCKLSSLNVIILKLNESLNNNKEILQAIEMYKKDFSLSKDDFLNICANEVIFRKLIKYYNKLENI